MVLLQPIMMLIMNVTTIAIIWFGSKMVGAGSLEIGNMMAFMQYVMQIMFSFLMVSMIFIMLPRASVAANRIAEVLDSEPSVKDPVHPKHPDATKKGVVEFRNVSFAYPGAEEPVLHDISFVAEPGKTTAFIGSTGSGKSTLINLIPRFYDATSGQVLVDGVEMCIRDRAAAV